MHPVQKIRCKNFQFAMMINFYVSFFREEMQKFSIHDDN